jgi:PAS domain S-box-containing protein
MLVLSQNKKIAVSALAIFIVSFSVMLFFLGNSGTTNSGGHASVMGSSETHSEDELVISDFAEFGEIETGYRLFIGNKEDPIIVVNREWEIQYTSKDFCDLMTVKCGTVLEETIFDLIESEDHEELFEISTDLVESGEKIETIGPMRIKKGLESEDQLLVILSAKVMRDEEGSVKSIVLSMKDLSDKVEEFDDDDEGEDGEDEEAKELAFLID